MPDIFSVVAFGCGYVESGQVSWVIFHAEDKTPTSEDEAINSLVEHLWRKYQAELYWQFKNKYGPRYQKCCWKITNDIKVCPECKTDLSKPLEFNLYEWEDMICKLHSNTADNYGMDTIVGDFDEPYGWTPWQYDFTVPPHQMVIIGENAEKIFTQRLAKLHPEVVNDQYDWDDILDNDFYEYKREEKYTPYKTTEIFRYKNGAVAVIEDSVYKFIKYNTGDRVWLKYKDGKYEVVKVKTNDKKNETL